MVFEVRMETVRSSRGRGHDGLSASYGVQSPEINWTAQECHFVRIYCHVSATSTLSSMLITLQLLAYTKISKKIK
jgi:hypothetical protein